MEGWSRENRRQKKLKKYAFFKKTYSLDLARNPPLNSKNALFARVGTEKVFALRAQGGGRGGYLEPKLHRVATLVKT